MPRLIPLVPSTYEEDRKCEFLLRILTEQDIEAKYSIFQKSKIYLLINYDFFSFQVHWKSTKMNW